MKTKVYFVRHGESESNENHDLVGERDVEINLTKRGREQVREVSKELIEKLKFASRFSVYSSPFFRAEQSAKIFINECKKELKNFTFDNDEPFYDIRLHEAFVLNRGLEPYEVGQTLDYLRDKAELTEYTFFQDKNFENISSVLLRAQSFLDRLKMEKDDNQVIIVFSHTFFITAVKAIVSGKNPIIQLQLLGREGYMKNASYFEMEI